MTRPLALACLLLVAPGRTVAIDVSFKITDARGQPVADAIVALYPLDAPVPPATRVPAVEIEQRDLQFSPFVTPLRTGSSAVLPNHEKKVEHHVYSSSPAKPFEFPLYKPGTAETVVFDHPGLVVLGCNIHDSMLAYVAVLETPWFAKTAADGIATIAADPPGRYRAEVWHPRLKDAVKSGLAASVQRELTLAPGAPAVSPSNVLPPAQSFTLALEPDRRIRRSPATSGGGYK